MDELAGISVEILRCPREVEIEFHFQDLGNRVAGLQMDSNHHFKICHAKATAKLGLAARPGDVVDYTSPVDLHHECCRTAIAESKSLAKPISPGTTVEPN